MRARVGTRCKRVVALLAVTAFALLAVAGSQAALRAFSSRFSVNAKANFVFVGNTLMTCPAVAACPSAQGGTGGTVNNNDFDMTYVDVDSDASTFDSSSASLALSAGSTVEFAGLYWGADTSAGVNGVDAPDPASNGSVLFTAPGAGQTTLTASPLDTNGTRYQGFADVTSLVEAAGNGTYTVANVQAGTGQDRYAGWSLVVVYANNAELTRNVTVFDGYQVVNTGTPTIDIPVSGFLTPPSGAVDTSLGVLAYEGDLGLVGDSLRLGPNVATLTTMTDAQNPATNFFNSTISRLGTLVTSKSPNYVNQLGFDTDVVDASGILPNGSSSAVMRLNTGGETYFPAVVVFATQLFAPDLLTTIAKTVTDVNGGSVVPGDTLEYAVSFTNTGTDSATNVVLHDPIPPGTTYVPGSLVVATGANAGTKTDAAGDDQAEHDAGTNAVVFRLGTGADATSGGVIAPAEATTIRFRVRVNAGTPGGTTVDNAAQLDYDALTLGTAYSGPSPTATVTVANAADLSITKTASRSTYAAGAPLTYTIRVTDNGPADVTGATVTDTVPPALASFVWTCAAGCTPASGTGNVSTSVDVAAGSTRTITLSGTVPPGTSGTISNTASVAAPAGVVDPSAGNNSATVSTAKAGTTPSPPPAQPPAASADVSVTKTGPATANVGDTVAFTLTAHNAGPDTATNVVLRDTLPPELQLISASGSCVTSGASVVCTVGSLAPSADTAFTIRAQVVGGAGGSVTNIARVAATTADPEAGNNSAAATLAVGSPPPPPPPPRPRPPSSNKTRLALTKRWAAAKVRAGGVARVYVVVRNTGAAAARDVVVCDRGSKQLSFVAATGAFYRRGSACWQTNELAPGRTKTFTVTVRVDRTAKGRRVLNVATATAGNARSVAASAWAGLLPARGSGRPGGVTG